MAVLGDILSKQIIDKMMNKDKQKIAECSFLLSIAILLN